MGGGEISETVTNDSHYGKAKRLQSVLPTVSSTKLRPTYHKVSCDTYACNVVSCQGGVATQFVSVQLELKLPSSKKTKPSDTSFLDILDN